MKIKIQSDSIRQFGNVDIECTDAEMSRILAARNGQYARFVSCSNQTLHEIKRARAENEPFEYCLQSGAKLKLGKKPGKFYVFGYHYAGKDIEQAVEELKCRNALQIAHRAFSKMRETSFDRYTFKDFLR